MKELLMEQPWMLPYGVMLLVLLVLACVKSHKRRLTCPACGSRRTILTGEWIGEDWQCLDCNHWWIKRVDA